MDHDDEVDVAYRLLDAEVRDVEHRRVGRVDDLVFSGGPGEDAYLAGFLSGSGAWHQRLPRPLRRLAARLFGTGTFGEDVFQVPWEHVDHVEASVILRCKGGEVGLGVRDEQLGRVLGKASRT
jgi:sporulation protein YlmC with PRC-barrel domain